jgi:hypothetical protein
VGVLVTPSSKCRQGQRAVVAGRYLGDLARAHDRAASTAPRHSLHFKHPEIQDPQLPRPRLIGLLYLRGLLGAPLRPRHLSAGGSQGHSRALHGDLDRASGLQHLRDRQAGSRAPRAPQRLRSLSSSITTAPSTSSSRSRSGAATPSASTTRPSESSTSARATRRSSPTGRSWALPSGSPAGFAAGSESRSPTSSATTRASPRPTTASSSRASEARPTATGTRPTWTSTARVSGRFPASRGAAHPKGWRDLPCRVSIA